MMKILVSRQDAKEGFGGATQVYVRVVEWDGDDPLPLGAVVVDESTPISDWTPVE
jgi:hypothetical protein